MCHAKHSQAQLLCMVLVCDILTGEPLLDLEDLFSKLTYSHKKVCFLI